MSAKPTGEIITCRIIRAAEETGKDTILLPGNDICLYPPEASLRRIYSSVSVCLPVDSQFHPVSQHEADHSSFVFVSYSRLGRLCMCVCVCTNSLSLFVFILYLPDFCLLHESSQFAGSFQAFSIKRVLLNSYSSRIKASALYTFSFSSFRLPPDTFRSR